ncbi:sigma-70 family RNA polymerase sigma factor [Achromobacter deleyi]|uniref:Sigma-70 family RNA polymerase sigma factor n=1 Tax=Achromobacter deleyi TaxID=1353891 RepID=A0A7T4E730_9BURK|nr:sigma-70 family RNA polymerase sigma factor [Achromobacter deleyi]QQB37761.1 sigma-70 family RNA polymerase sigma factor [Achromobacter deleyi]
MPHRPAPDFDYEAALKECAAGRRAALEALYRQEGPRLLGVAQRILRDRARAEDIVHDAFVNIWKRAAGFDATRGSARGWLYSIARNLALNAVRDSRHETGMDEDTAAALDIRDSMQAWHDTHDAFEWRDSAGRIGPCLEQLEPVRRNCLLHAYVEGLSQSEIAQRIGAPLGTVKAWIKRSLKALKECLA